MVFLPSGWQNQHQHQKQANKAKIQAPFKRGAELEKPISREKLDRISHRAVLSRTRTRPQTRQRKKPCKGEMAMAAISTITCCIRTSVCTVSCTNSAFPTTFQGQQSVAAAQYVGSRRLSQGGKSLADVGLQQPSKKRSFGGCGHSRQSLQQQLWRVDAGLKETALTEQKWGPPITLGTAQLPQDVDLGRLETLLYQWGNNLTQNANLPLPVPLKVDRIEGGVRLGYIKVVEGTVEDIVHIDVIVTPPSEEQPNAMFRAIRNGQMKSSVPPGEPLIMQSLLAALKMSLPLARASS